MEYSDLKPGDELQSNDEYSTSRGVWRVIPDFMEGDIIPDNEGTEWRRPIVGKKQPKPLMEKKHWWKK